MGPFCVQSVKIPLTWKSSHSHRDWCNWPISAMPAKQKTGTTCTRKLLPKKAKTKTVLKSMCTIPHSTKHTNTNVSYLFVLSLWVCPTWIGAVPWGKYCCHKITGYFRNFSQMANPPYPPFWEPLVLGWFCENFSSFWWF